MQAQDTIRDIYHGVRQASRPGKTKAHIRSAVKVPRGYARVRDALIDRVRDLRRIRDPLERPLHARVEAELVRRALRVIEQRGLSTPAGWEDAPVRLYERFAGLSLVGAEYRYEYSRRAGTWWQGASYLVGYEDGQAWAIRVPRSIKTIAEAIRWSTPAAVRDAQHDAYRGADVLVRRQGDVYFVGRPRGKTDFSDLLGTRHEAREHGQGGYTVDHPEHRAVRLSGKYHWRVYLTRQDAGGRRGCGD